MGFLSNMFVGVDFIPHFNLNYCTDNFYRAGIMYTSENDELDKQLRSNMFSLSGTGFFGAVGRSINLGENHLFLFIPLHREEGRM